MDKTINANNSTMNAFQRAFLRCCSKGRFEDAVRIFCESDVWFDLSDYNEIAFRYACKYGDLKFVQWLWDMNPQMDMSVYHYRAFRVACCNGHLSVAQWLLRHNPHIDMSYDDEAPFRWSCENGHIAVAKWLLELRPNLDIHARDHYAFQWSCHFGHLEVAKWIYQVSPIQDLQFMNHWLEMWHDDGTIGGVHGDVFIWLNELMNGSSSTPRDKAIQTIERLKMSTGAEGCPCVEETDAICSICVECPLKWVADCGHAYCEACAVNWCEKSGGGYDFICAYCRVKITKLNVYTG